MHAVRVLAVLTLVAAVSLPGWADRTPEAKMHFEEGQKHFAVGEFDQAGEEYLLAYKARPDSALLYNAAQAFRIANRPERALTLYRNYAQFYPDAPNLEEVKAQIAKLKEAIVAADKAKNSPPPGTASPQSLESAQNTAASSDSNDSRTTRDSAKLESAASPESTGDRKSPTPLYRKWWLWTVAGVVVVGAGVGLAVGLTANRAWANGPTVGPGVSSSLSVPAAGVRW